MNPTLDELQAAFTRLLSPSTEKGSAPAPGAVLCALAENPTEAVEYQSPAVQPGGLEAGREARPATPEAGVLPNAVSKVDPKTRGYHLDVTVTPDQVVAAAEIVRQRGFGMDTVTGVDWMAAGQMEVVYDFFHPASVLHVVVRTRVPREKPELPTIQGVFPGANWHERETHDFFGIKFLGHPDLSPLLLPEDADFHPLRKDYAGAA